MSATCAHLWARPESALTAVVAHLCIAPTSFPFACPNWRIHGSKGKKAGGSRLPCGSTHRLERVLVEQQQQRHLCDPEQLRARGRELVGTRRLRIDQRERGWGMWHDGSDDGH